MRRDNTISNSMILRHILTLILILTLTLTGGGVHRLRQQGGDRKAAPLRVTPTLDLALALALALTLTLTLTRSWRVHSMQT